MNSQTKQKQFQSNKQNGINQQTVQSSNKLELNKPKYSQSLNHYIVVQTKKKKQVIQILSSESEVQGKAKGATTNTKQTQNQEKTKKTRKIKKTVLKCQLCKVSGKKSEMKLCTECKKIFHLTCIDLENKLSKRFICVKCKFTKDQQIKQKPKKEPEQKQLTLQTEKTIPKKTQKQKKKQQYNRRLNEFMDRYPYYFQDDQKIKYPIEDKLLIIYRQLFEITQNTRPKPKSHPLIPSGMVADFLQIQNFFSTFSEQLQGIYTLSSKKINKNYFYLTMNNQVIDQTYSQMIYCLIKIYLSDIFEKNKTENVKMLNENCFFTLLTNMNENDDLDENIIVSSAMEILRNLSTIPSMKKSFEDFQFTQKYSLQDKVQILVKLIKGLSQIDTFHELVAAKSQKMQNMTKQKGQLINQLKADEAQNLQNKQKIKQFVNADLQLDQQLNKNDENGSLINTRQLTRQKDKNKKKIQKLASEKDKSQRNILQIRQKISQISKHIPFVTSQVIYLGKDRNQSQYFFNSNEPNRIYCQYHEYLFDDNEQYYIYEGKQSINQLVKSFNVKGLHEKHLVDVINYFIKEQIIYDVNDQKQSLFNTKPQIQHSYTQIDRQNIVKIVLQLQETFSNYLTMKNLQWSGQSERQNLLQNLKHQTDLHEIKRIIITIQQSFLFVQPMTQQTINRFTVIDSDQQIKQDRRQFKKKSPVRLWGINSQRIKKYWVEYMEQAIDLKGIWICANILRNYVNRYVQKKMEYLIQQQKKQEKLEKQKQKKQRFRLRKQREEQDRNSRDRSREQKAPRRGRPRKKVQLSQSEEEAHIRPNLRQRKKLKFQIDSDISAQQQDQEYQSQQGQQQSQNEDRCAVCSEYGDMICCDTCPKVFHLECLKIKQIPDGEWSCVECLQKIANSRQTRSRVKQIKKGAYN